jgi:hypothetical protein
MNPEPRAGLQALSNKLAVPVPPLWLLEPLWTQKQAAGYLQVSVRYLRESSCPKVLLPGNGERGKPLVRYEPITVREWWQARQATVRKAS